MTSIDFDVDFLYDSSSEGILLPVQILHAGKTVEFVARLDTGAADCIVDRFFAEALGIDVESGMRRTYQTVAGSFVAYGHEITIRTLELEWSAVVFFYEAATRRQNFIGRTGWLDRVRLGIVHYDQQIFLAPYR